MPTGTRPAPPDDVCRLVLSGLNLTHRWVNVMWLNLTATSRAQADLQSIVDSVSSAWNTNFAPVLANGGTMTNVLGVWTTPGGGEIVANNSTVRTMSQAGTVIADAAASYVINWHINAYYRGGHPRSYFPGVVSTAVTNGSDVTTTQQGLLAPAASAYLTAVNALTHGGITAVTLGTVSFVHAHAWRTPPIFRPFQSVSVRAKLGTQRRRILS